MTNFARVSCGCETAENRLVSVCALHGNYMRQHVEAAKQSRINEVDKDLQRDLIRALAPIVVSKADYTREDAADVANKIHNQVYEIIRRMD